MGNIPLFPEQASTFAGPVDTLYFALIGLALLFAVPVAVLIIYFAIKYRRGSDADRSGAITQSTAIETTWIILPLFLALGVFTWGARLYLNIYEIPADGMDVMLWPSSGCGRYNTPPDSVRLTNYMCRWARRCG
ncbi:MAG: hypothetical protein R2867_11435 [Caldilineaceae bacterium]